MRIVCLVNWGEGKDGVTARGTFTCIAFSIKMREYEEARYDDANVQDWDEHRGHDDGVAVADVFLDSVQCLCVFVSDPGDVAERRTFRPTRSIDLPHRRAASNSPLHSLPPCLVAARSLSSAMPPPMSGSVAGRPPRYVLYCFHVLTFWSNTTQSLRETLQEVIPAKQEQLKKLVRSLHHVPLIGCLLCLPESRA